MGKPRLAIGTFGDITFIRRGKRVEARTRFRDWDGQTRLVQATAGSRPAAERALKHKLAARMETQPSFMALTADSTFGDLVAYWLADLDQVGRLTPSTRQLYERNMRTLVMPAFERLTLREIGVARCDHFIKQLAQQSYSRARQARMVMRLAFALAVRHEVLPRNPMLNVSRLSKPASTPNALTPTEVNAVRAAVMHWERGISPSGPKPDGQLGLIVEVMLGTSARIGEVLALRRRDLDVTSSPPTARIGTIVSAKGMPFTRQDHPKTDRSRRIVALPEFAAEAVRKRLTVMADRSLDGLLFASRNGTPLSPNNLRREEDQHQEDRDTVIRARADRISPIVIPAPTMSRSAAMPGSPSSLGEISTVAAVACDKNCMPARWEPATATKSERPCLRYHLLTDG